MPKKHKAPANPAAIDPASVNQKLAQEIKALKQENNQLQAQTNKLEHELTSAYDRQENLRCQNQKIADQTEQNTNLLADSKTNNQEFLILYRKKRTIVCTTDESLKRSEILVKEQESYSEITTQINHSLIQIIARG